RSLTVALATVRRDTGVVADRTHAIAYVFDPEQKMSELINPVCQLYGLSNSETKLTCALVAGDSLRWSRLLGQVGGEVKLIPDVIMPPVWSSDHGGHAPHDLKHRSVHRPLPGFAPLDPSAVAACCSR